MERGLRKWFILNHSNVLPLCGFVRESDTKIPSLVTERADYNGADHRSLQMILKKGENVDIISLVRPFKSYASDRIQSELYILRQIEGIADGLCYLHSSDIIHSDLRSVRSSLLNSIDKLNLTIRPMSLSRAIAKRCSQTMGSNVLFMVQQGRNTLGLLLKARCAGKLLNLYETLN